MYLSPFNENEKEKGDKYIYSAAEGESCRAAAKGGAIYVLSPFSAISPFSATFL
jgi:hypothetical protein